jgi:hypothetical protein
MAIAGTAAFGFGFLSSLRAAPAQERFDLKVREDYFLGGRAFHSGDSEKGMDLVKRGMGKMAGAVELEPDSVGVRIPRGAIYLQSSLSTPDNDFTRNAVRAGVEDDMRTLKLQNANLDSLGVHPRSDLPSGIASAHSRLGSADEAERFYQSDLDRTEGRVYTKSADKWLQRKALEPIATMCLGCHAVAVAK